MGWKTIQSAFWSAALIAAIAATAQSPAPEPAPLGKMVDLGGYRIHLYCTGKGKETIVLSPGGGDFSFVWYLVQQQYKPLRGSARMIALTAPGAIPVLSH
jgi:hypothetical protein